MAKLLTDLPASFLSEPPEPASKPSPGVPNRASWKQPSKALAKPGSKSTMNDHSDWMIRRCDAFGIASSRYFKKNQSCPRPKKD